MQGSLFKTCTSTKVHIWDEQLQRGILKGDFTFAPLPLLFQVTPSAAVSVLLICFNCLLPLFCPKLSSFKVCAEPMVSGKLDFSGNELLSCVRSCGYVNKIDGCSAGLALSSPFTPIRSPRCVS